MTDDHQIQRQIVDIVQDLNVLLKQELIKANDFTIDDIFKLNKSYLELIQQLSEIAKQDRGLKKELAS